MRGDFDEDELDDEPAYLGGGVVRTQAMPCKAMEAHRDGRGLWAIRFCCLPSKHGQRHAFGRWNHADAVPALQKVLNS